MTAYYQPSKELLADMANALRALTMDAIECAQSGHPGMPMGMADVAAVLFSEFITLDPEEPAWPDRDRFVLSAGHGSMLQYALHHLLGYHDMPVEELQRFRQLGGKAAGHPEYGHTMGVETTTGPLGQGLATAVGMALAERMLNARFGDMLVNHFTYVIAGDGCLMEGISQEAIDLAGHLKLSRLCVLWDDNGISIDGPTWMATGTDQLMRFRAAGWHTCRVDGHDVEAVRAALRTARSATRPTLIACKTVIGYGAPHKAGTAAVHGAPLGEQEVAAARARLGWPFPSFYVPDGVREAFRTVALRGQARRKAWEARVKNAKGSADFLAAFKSELPAELQQAVAAHCATLREQKPAVASRKASESVLEVLSRALPNLVGGSADLTPSNNTRVQGMRPVTRHDYGGSYIHFGVREHAMAAAMNGLSLHGGLIPYGGTFLVFSDYARPAIRLSALMGVRLVYVMTHDSIGLGEDGPTHQPVEHLSALRAIPNLLVFRPADALETAECWQLALEAERAPSLLCLSRQNLPFLNRDQGTAGSARGGYVVSAPVGRRDVTLLATGSEVALAMEAQGSLAARGIAAAVVSMPCFALFERQSREYQLEVLGTAPRVAVEAGVRQGWDRYLGRDGDFVGMDSFGASAPAKALFVHFGITAEAVAARALSLIAGRDSV